MKKSPKLILKKIFQSALVFILFIDVYELLSYLVAADDYRFGTEVNGWRYSSETHYCGVLLLELFLIFLVLCAGFRGAM